MNKLNIKITDIELSVRCTNSLHAINIKTIKDLICFSAEELLTNNRGMGKKNIIEIRKKLKEMNLKLKDEPIPFVPEKGIWYEMKKIKPPEEDENYLIIHRVGLGRNRIKMARWGQKSYDKWNWVTSSFTASSVTHWRCLPKTPILPIR